MLQRRLNDYESMLSTSTCNVALRLKLPPQTTIVKIRDAWNRCVTGYQLLQVRIVPILNSTGDAEMGVLGPCYETIPISSSDTGDLFQLQESQSPYPNLLAMLQKVGCTALTPEKGSYRVVGYMERPPSAKAVEVAMVLSLSHALSDGPGAMQVANAFLEELSAMDATSVSATESDPQPLINLQAMLLGNDYSKGASAKEKVFRKMHDYQEQLLESPVSKNVLLPEAKQGIPSDNFPSDQRGWIDFCLVSLTREETTRLRDNCRSWGGSVQGAISAAALYARLRALGMLTDTNATATTKEIGPISCAIQVPMNTRTLVNPSMKGSESLMTSCLCGSAGVVHPVIVDCSRPEWRKELVVDCTRQMREAIQEKQPLEWLWRLLHNPVSLVPYSLMASSVGVAPVRRKYEVTDTSPSTTIEVEECHFFGASLHTPSTTQGTMVHAVTFDGQLQAMLNYTTPGIAKKFMEDAAQHFQDFLKHVSM